MTETNPIGTVTDWTDNQWLNFTFWLKDVLRREVVEVIFTKTDGTERVMKCTMQTSVIDEGTKLLLERLESNTEKPQTRVKKSKSAQTSDHITVWDVEAQNWRSFRTRKLTNVLTLIIRYDYAESLKQYTLVL